MAPTEQILLAAGNRKGKQQSSRAPRIRGACVNSRRRSLPSVAVTAALALFLAAAPRQRQRLAGATLSSTMDESSSIDAEGTDDDSGSTPSPSTSFPATAGPASTPEWTTSTNAPTVAPTVEGTSAPEGGLGAGMVKGMLSATGVSALLIDTVGEESVIQEAVCALTPCPRGAASVVVGEAGLETRRLLEAEAAVNAELRQSPHRRLYDFDAVAFTVPTESSGGEAGEGGMTGIQYATTMINQIANNEGLTLAANVLGVDAKDLTFENVQYFQGAEVPFAADLDFALQQDADDAQEPEDGGAVLAALVVGLLVLLTGCLTILFSWRHRAGSNNKRSKVQDREIRRVAPPATEPRADAGNQDPDDEDPEAQQQFSTLGAMGSSPTAATSKARAESSRAMDVDGTPVDMELDELEKPSSSQPLDHRTSSFRALHSFQASREHLYEYYGAEYADSDACSDLVGLDIVPGTTPDHNYNPLFGNTGSRSPISAVAWHQQPQLPRRPFEEVAGATWPSPIRNEDGGAIGATVATAAAVKANVTAAKSPVSTVTKPKVPWRSPSPRLGESLWVTARTALKTSNTDDETETSSNALLSAATSNATDTSFAPRPTSVSRETTAFDSSSGDLWDVAEVSAGRNRSNRGSHDDALQTTEGVRNHPSTESRPTGAPTATETSQPRPLSPLVGGDGKGPKGSEPLSCVSPNGGADTGKPEIGEAEAGEAETVEAETDEPATGGAATANTIEIVISSSPFGTSSSPITYTTGGNGATSGQGLHDLDDERERSGAAARESATPACGDGNLHPDTCGRGSEETTSCSEDEKLKVAPTTTDQLPSESFEGTTACIGGLPDTTPETWPSPLPSSPDRDGTAVTAAAASCSTNDPGNGDGGDGGGRNGEVDVDERRQHLSVSTSSPVSKGLLNLPDRTSVLMDELISTVTSRNGGLTPMASSIGHSVGPDAADENDGTIPSSPIEKKVPVKTKAPIKTTAPITKHVRFLSLPDLHMSGSDDEEWYAGESPPSTRDGESFSQPHSASDGGDQNQGFLIHEQQEKRGAETAHVSRHHRRQSSGSTDSSLASLPLSPAFMKRFPHLQTGAAGAEREDTDSWLSSALSIPRREFSFFPRREFGSFPGRGHDEAESAPSSAPVSPSIVKARHISFVETPRTQPDAVEDPRGRGHSTSAAKTYDERRRLPATWQGIVEAATLGSYSGDVRFTRASSMPDVPTYARDGRKHRHAAQAGRFSSVGGEAVGRRGGRNGVTVPAAELAVGSAYDELFAKRGRSPKAVRPTEGKGRKSGRRRQREKAQVAR